MLPEAKFVAVLMIQYMPKNLHGDHVNDNEIEISDQAVGSFLDSIDNEYIIHAFT